MIDASNDDLDGFRPNAGDKKLDDKTVYLENELVALKSSFNKERVTYHFVIGILLNIIIFYLSSDGSVKYLTLFGSVIVLYATARWLDHPWMGDTLARWHDLLFEACRRKLVGKTTEETEPLPIDHGKNERNIN
nr:hypothetical protein [uncultured Gellertiella sp.]